MFFSFLIQIGDLNIAGSIANCAYQKWDNFVGEDLLGREGKGFWNNSNHPTYQAGEVLCELLVWIEKRMRN
jgi:hypothetical protein